MKKSEKQIWIPITFLVFGLWIQGNLANSQEKNLPSAHFSPVPDPSAVDDPSLPRYLFIGDSISSNYGKAIRDLHAGKINVHQPPTNCRSSSNGRDNLSSWLGDFRQKGRQWDVISFNFGHWDAENSKRTRLGEQFIATAPFAAAIYKAHRYWNPRKEKNEDLQLLRAATFYRQWQRREQRNGN